MSPSSAWLTIVFSLVIQDIAAFVPVHSHAGHWLSHRHALSATGRSPALLTVRQSAVSEEEKPLPPSPDLDARTVPLELEAELADSFMRYSMSIITGRALPDLRDGLKPVHRRILFAMHELNLKPSGGYRKCARVVGEVLGKFHPHGDLSVYDALVRMAQDFVMSAPLVAGHGNFGSLDNDPPAAMRYTECKLSPLASSALLADLDSDTVDFAPNFDGNEVEPVVLPARLPLLLLNGATGIAVGMATNVPPHNLGELVGALDAFLDAKLTTCEKQAAAAAAVADEGNEASTAAAVAAVEEEKVTDAELFKLVPGPDFPTGGVILGRSGARSMYATGHGSVALRALAGIEEVSARTASGKITTRTAVVVREVPYSCNKAALLERIAQLVNEKKLTGIADLRDESDRDGVRVVIELKRDANSAVVLNNLWKMTSLQTSFSGNFLALRQGGTSPGRFTLREALDEFLDFRFETVRRRAAFRRGAAAARAHVVDGLLLAIGQVDAVIAVIRAEPNRASAKRQLMAPADGKMAALSGPQAEAVLSLQLGRLTSLDEQNLAAERADLTSELAYLDSVLGDAKVTWSVIRAELQELASKHVVPRRTRIDDSFGDEADSEISEEDLLANDRSVVVVTRSGYIKRMPLDHGDFSEPTLRGTRGKAGASKTTKSATATASAGGAVSAESAKSAEAAAKEDAASASEVAHFFTCNDHDLVLFLTMTGRVLGLKAWQIPAAARTAKGVPLVSLLPVSRDEAQMAAVLPVDKEGFESAVATAAETGDDGTHAAAADDDDDDVDSKAVSAAGIDNESSEDGDDDVGTPLENDSVAAPMLLMVTKQGWIKKTPLAAFAKVTRRSKGLAAITLGSGDGVQWARICGWPSKSSTSATIATTSTSLSSSISSDGGGSSEEVEEEEGAQPGVAGVETIMLATRDGYATRFGLGDKEVRPTGRTSRGVKAMKLRSGDEIVDMDVLPAQGSGDEADFLVVTANGYGKRCAASEFRVGRRGGLGVIATKFKKPKKKTAATTSIAAAAAAVDDNNKDAPEASPPATPAKKPRGRTGSAGAKAGQHPDRLACLRAVSEADEILLSTTAGVIVRQRASGIPRQSRAATGVLVQRLDDGSTISEVAVVPKSMSSTNSNNGTATNVATATTVTTCSSAATRSSSRSSGRQKSTGGSRT